MALKNGRHVVPRFDGGWSVRRSGASRASRVFSSEAEAIAYARDQARQARSDLYVHREDGTVKIKSSYAGEGSDEP